MTTGSCLPPVLWAEKSYGVSPGPPRLAVALLMFILAPDLPAVVSAQQIQFQPGELLKAAGQTLDVGSYAIPCAADWNGEGRKDLLVGYQTAGKIALYLNSGSDASPVFTTSVNLQAGGRYLSPILGLRRAGPIRVRLRP